MKRMRIPAVAAAGVVASLALVGPVSAQEGPGLVVDPTSGPGGTVITVSGADCVDGEGNPGDVWLELYDVDAPDQAMVAGDSATADASGAWNGQLEVSTLLQPGTPYAVYAECSYGEGEDDWFPYVEVPFEVTGTVTPPTTEPPVTTAPTTEPPAATPAPATPAPATPVTQEPGYNG
jgi:hypothetical protein